MTDVSAQVVAPPVTPRRVSWIATALGFACGLPFSLLVGSVSVWLTNAGIGFGTIGALSWIGLFYAFKFIWSPAFDWLVPPFANTIGRRRVDGAVPSGDRALPVRHDVLQPVGEHHCVCIVRRARGVCVGEPRHCRRCVADRNRAGRQTTRQDHRAISALLSPLPRLLAGPWRCCLPICGKSPAMTRRAGRRFGPSWRC